MNGAIRKIALGLGLAFLALVVNLNVVQLARSSAYEDNRYNKRHDLITLNIKRGEIVAADGQVVARSVPSGNAEQYIWSRRYPLGATMGQITGYFTYRDFCFPRGLEETQSDVLTGLDPPRSTDFVDELLGRKHDGNSIKLTVYPELQLLAKKKYGSQRGGVAVIDTHTGAVMGLYGTPTYDPNLITERPVDQCGQPIQQLDANPKKPLLSRAYDQRYPPGSTFKIITAAAGIELGKMTERTSFRTYTRLDLPQTDKSLGNFGGGTCGGSILHSFEISCNTTFAQVGLKIGEKKLKDMAHRFGLGTDLGFDLPALPSCVVVPSEGRSCNEDQRLAPPFVAYSSIGQYDVRVTPLQMAVVAATVENGGFRPTPHVVDRIYDENNHQLARIEPELSKRIYSKKTAKQMQHLMTAVVCNGTGRVVGFRDACRGVGGKTGTAQSGSDAPPHVWFVAWEKGIAVAAMVENGGSLRSEATGGRVAGPIAKAMLEQALRIKARAR